MTKKKIAYLGPEGTFTEQALRSQEDLSKHEFISCKKFTDVLAATSKGEADYGFVAIENAIEGAVNITLDLLAFEHDLYICREVELNVDLNLVSQRGLSLDDIEMVFSHPVALAQCRNFLNSKLNHAESMAANSTAAAAEIAARKNNKAALATSLAAQRYNLDILEANVQDHPDNKTRFVLLSKDHIPPATGHDKSSVVLTQHTDGPGSLISILQEFAARNINLSSLTSRPVKTSLGDYCFIVDFQGHISDNVVADCLKVIKARHADVKFLGSYASCSISKKSKNQSDDNMKSANMWLENIQAQVALS